MRALWLCSSRVQKSLLILSWRCMVHKNHSDPWILATVHTEVTVLDYLVEYSFIINYIFSF